MKPKPIIPVLAGLTASGKSSLALELAQGFPLEIVTADAMQVYQGMDIGTAKPSQAEQQRVPHHLIDLVSPAEVFSVSQWTARAEQCIDGILKHDAIPLVVGGTGFYITALQRGLPTVPAVDADVQAALWQRFEIEGIDVLVKELEHTSLEDAVRCQRNPRRVIRALEVIQRTGKPPSQFPFTTPRYSLRTVVIAPSVEVIQQRIAKRVQEMLEAGLVREVQTLTESYPAQPTALQAIGYKEILAYLQKECSLDDAVGNITLATVQYAKRQRTWFKKMADVTIVDDANAAKILLEQWLAHVQ